MSITPTRRCSSTASATWRRPCAGAEEEPVSEIRAARDRAERDAILTTLRQCSWNVTEAAKRLGMDRGYLHRKIKRYGLVRDAQTP